MRAAAALKFLRRLIDAAIAGAILYGLFRFYAVWTTGFDWDEMDWDQDGSTSLSDLFRSTDIGRREVSRDGRFCFEYYSLKDATTIRLDCTSY